MEKIDFFEHAASSDSFAYEYVRMELNILSDKKEGRLGENMARLAD